MLAKRDRLVNADPPTRNKTQRIAIPVTRSAMLQTSCQGLSFSPERIEIVADCSQLIEALASLAILLRET